MELALQTSVCGGMMEFTCIPLEWDCPLCTNLAKLYSSFTSKLFFILNLAIGKLSRGHLCDIFVVEKVQFLIVKTNDVFILWNL